MHEERRKTKVERPPAPQIPSPLVDYLKLRDGSALIEILTRVYRLQNRGKMSEAVALLDTMPKFKVLQECA